MACRIYFWILVDLATNVVKLHGFTAVASSLASAKPAEAYPTSLKLRRVTLFALPTPPKQLRLRRLDIHGFTPVPARRSAFRHAGVAFCEGG